MSAHVFVSYASADRDRAMAIADAFETAGISVWIDRRGISGGSRWAEEISSAIRSAGAVAILCSAASIESRNVRQELQLAWDAEKPILPFLLEQVSFPDAVAYFVHGTQWVEILDRSEQTWLPDALQALPNFHAGGHGQKPAVPVATPARSSLPTPLTGLLGRESDLEKVVELLRANRLVTLTGTGGVGKTRLAIEAARTVSASFPDGVIFVDLAPVVEPRLALSTIANAAGVVEAAGRSLVDTLQSAIGGQRLLIVLDNVERLLGAAPDIGALLGACPGLTILATSRSPLGLRGELRNPVEPLSSTPHDATLPSDKLRSVPSVALFVARATEADPEFIVDDEELRVIAQICARLDGLPLAIELAAARVQLLSPDMLLAKLEQRLPMLTSGARDLPDRQRTLRDAIAWSYDLLTPTEQALFRQLGVFTGGWTLDAATAVIDAAGEQDVLGGMATLIDRSLVRRVGRSGRGQRFHMLETIREFGFEQSRELGELSAVRESHLSYFSSATSRARSELKTTGQKAWYTWVDEELGNLRAAMAWAMESGTAGPAFGIMGDLGFYWFWRSQFAEGLDWAKRLLMHEAGVSPALVLRVMFHAGLLAHHSGDNGLLRELNDAAGSRAHAIGDDLSIAISGNLRSFAARAEGDHRAAVSHAEAAVEAARRTTDVEILGASLVRLGAELHIGGALDEAEPVHREALAFLQHEGDDIRVALVQANLADLAAERRERARAAAGYRECGHTLMDFGVWWLIVDLFVSLAELAAREAEPERGACLLGAAEALRKRIGLVLYGLGEQSHGRAIALLNSQLTSEQLDSHMATGASLSTSDAFAAAMELADSLANRDPVGGG